MSQKVKNKKYCLYMYIDGEISTFVRAHKEIFEEEEDTNIEILEERRPEPCILGLTDERDSLCFCQNNRCFILL